MNPTPTPEVIPEVAPVTQPATSSRFGTVNMNDIKHVAVHCVIVAVLSFAVYLTDQVFPQMNFGANQALATTVVATVAVLLKRALTTEQVIS